MGNLARKRASQIFAEFSPKNEATGKIERRGIGIVFQNFLKL